MRCISVKYENFGQLDKLKKKLLANVTLSILLLILIRNRTDTIADQCHPESPPIKNAQRY